MPPIPPDVARRSLDLVIDALNVIRDHLEALEVAAAKERRLIAQVELAALRDLQAADDADAESEVNQ